VSDAFDRCFSVLIYALWVMNCDDFGFCWDLSKYWIEFLKLLLVVVGEDHAWGFAAEDCARRCLVYFG